MTLVIIMGDIDLSVGNAIAWSGLFDGCDHQRFARAALPGWLGHSVCHVLAVISGILGGVLTGWLRTRFSVPAFITTLALMFAYKGGAYLITDSFPVIPFPGVVQFFRQRLRL